MRTQPQTLKAQMIEEDCRRIGAGLAAIPAGAFVAVITFLLIDFGLRGNKLSLDFLASLFFGVAVGYSLYLHLEKK